MTVDLLNHNGGPPLEEAKPSRRRSVRTAWAKALFDDPKTPTYVMAMGWVLHWYSNSDGTGAVLSNEQFERICNISRPTVTKGKEWLRNHGYVAIKAGDGRGVKSTFTLTLPEGSKEKTRLPLSGDDGAAVQEAASATKEVTPLRETSLPETTKQETPLQKGETRLQKGETSLQKGETTLPLNQDINQYNTQEYNQKPAHARVRSPWSALNPYSAEASHECWVDEEGLIRLANGFRREILEKAGGDEQRLAFWLEKFSARIAPGCEGIALKKRVRELAADEALKRHDQDERYLKAATANKQQPAKPKVSLRRF